MKKLNKKNPYLLTLYNKKYKPKIVKPKKVREVLSAKKLNQV